MAQSLSRLIVHAVFSTKDRRALLRSEEIQSETYSYMAGILKNLQCHGLFCFRPSGDPKCPNLQAA